MPYWVFPAGQVRQLDLRLNPVREDQLFDSLWRKAIRKRKNMGPYLNEKYSNLSKKRPAFQERLFRVLNVGGRCVLGLVFLIFAGLDTFPV
jgi:hypothetical protein